MYSQILTSRTSHAHRATKQTPAPSPAQRCFCPGVSCFTDEVVVRRVSSHSDVWLLTDESDNQSWLMKAPAPVCPHCGSLLLA